MSDAPSNESTGEPRPPRRLRWRTVLPRAYKAPLGLLLLVAAIRGTVYLES